MKILIVYGNHKPVNHTTIIVETYKRTAEKEGHEVKVIDVYSKEFALTYATGARLPEGSPDIPVVKASQDLIAWSEEIVFIHPVWWSNLPAGLKNWLDMIISPGYAYKYVNGRPEGLLTQRVKVFCTAGSHAPYYLIPVVRLFTPLHLLWKYALIEFCGMDLIEFTVCDKMNVNNSAPPEGHFEKFLRRVEFSAKFVH